MAPEHQQSYRRTLLLALVSASAAIVGATVATRWTWGAVSSALLATGWLVGALFLLVAASAIVVLGRDVYQRRTHANLFEVLNRARSESALSRGVDLGLRLRHAIGRLVWAGGFTVGELVEIRSYDEIVATLDDEGCVAALPFLAEMRRYCGKRARIFRHVDKVYDYGRSKQLRRLDDTYSLSGLRCDGSAHGDCQAECYLLWKSSWLKRFASSESARDRELSEPNRPHSQALASDIPRRAPLVDGEPTGKYRCQFTQLVAASTPLSQRDYRQDLRPLLAGNLTVLAFSLAALTRFFNFVQGLRGGAGYPILPRRGTQVAPQPGADIRDGALVKVRDASEIVSTFDRGTLNRGLYFDPEMTKYCGRSCVVKKRVNRLIDDATGVMRVMKSPCIVLEGVDFTGETLRFVAQHEYMYWRDVWLALVKSPSPQVAEREKSR